MDLIQFMSSTKHIIFSIFIISFFFLNLILYNQFFFNIYDQGAIENRIYNYFKLKTFFLKSGSSLIEFPFYFISRIFDKSFYIFLIFLKFLSLGFLFFIKHHESFNFRLLLITSFIFFYFLFSPYHPDILALPIILIGLISLVEKKYNKSLLFFSLLYFIKDYFLIYFIILFIITYYKRHRLNKKYLIILFLYLFLIFCITILKFQFDYNNQVFEISNIHILEIPFKKLLICFFLLFPFLFFKQHRIFVIFHIPFITYLLYTDGNIGLRSHYFAFQLIFSIFFISLNINFSKNFYKYILVIIINLFLSIILSIDNFNKTLDSIYNYDDTQIILNKTIEDLNIDKPLKISSSNSISHFNLSKNLFFDSFPIGVVIPFTESKFYADILILDKTGKYFLSDKLVKKNYYDKFLKDNLVNYTLLYENNKLAIYKK